MQIKKKKTFRSSEIPWWNTKCDKIPNAWNNFTEVGREIRCWPKWLWKWKESIRWKAKGIIYKYHFPWWYGLAILKPLYMYYIGIEELNKWIIADGNQVVGAVGYSKQGEDARIICVVMD